MYQQLAGTLDSKTPEGGIGASGAPRGCRESAWGCQSVYGLLGVYLDASSDSRCSGTSMGIGGIRGL